MSSELKIRAHLIDDYKRFRDLRKIAEKEGATETVKKLMMRFNS